MSIYKNIVGNIRYKASPDSLVIKTIDMHTEGEPLRVIVSGFPELKGDTVLERRVYLKEHLDQLRTSLMFEPRGHADMYGCILTPPNTSESDFGIIFMHNEGYSTMCGHATIAITKLAVEMGWVELQEPVTTIKIDAPCGQLTAYAQVQKGVVTSVSFDNVPSFLFQKDLKLDLEGYGELKVDVAYGGAFYAFVNADEMGIEMVPSNINKLIKVGMDVKRATQESIEVRHPFETDLSFLYGTIFTGKSLGNADSRNVCIFADGEVDRSPTGSGVSARMAIQYAQGTMKIGDSMKIESILGSTFVGSIKETVDYGGLEAIIPNVAGTAFITGQHEFIIDPQDPMKDGFILR